MQVTETLNEGLKRGYTITVTATAGSVTRTSQVTLTVT